MSGIERIAPAPTVETVVDQLKLDFASEALDRAAKFARKAAGAARRRDRIAFHVRLRQARLCVRAAIESLDDRDPPA